MKFIQYLIILITSTLSITLLPRIGCRDNSWHMEKQYDYKDDHAVACSCPCPDTIDRCIQCGHYHEPKPWIIIKTVNKKNAKNS